MNASLTSRRDFLRVTATGALAATAVAALASDAAAYQGNMERALSALYDALGSLREATADKGGHRHTAIELVQQAIAETQAGIDYADQRGG